MPERPERAWFNFLYRATGRVVRSGVVGNIFTVSEKKKFERWKRYEIEN